MDLNNFGNGFHVFATNSLSYVTNKPTDVSGFLLVFTYIGANNSRGLQVLFDSRSSYTYKRTLSDTWGEWNKY